MPILNVDPSKFNQENLPIGWYDAEVISVDFAKPKTGDGNTMNIVVIFKVIKGSQQDREVRNTYNTGALGRMGGLIAAAQNMTAKEYAETHKGQIDFDTDSLIGKKVKIRIIHESWQGRQVQKVDDVVPYGSATPAAQSF